MPEPKWVWLEEAFQDARSAIERSYQEAMDALAEFSDPPKWPVPETAAEEAQEHLHGVLERPSA